MYLLSRPKFSVINNAGYISPSRLVNSTDYYSLFRSPPYLKVSKKSLPWSLLTLAITLMTLRSIITLGQLFTPETVLQLDFKVEVMVLTISALMALGIERITPIVAGLRSSAERQRKSTASYHTIFENSPISIWEEDFSEIKARFLCLRREGITDLESHFNQRPEAVQQCAELIRITDVNKVTLTLLSANIKEELLADLVKTFTAELFHTFQEELISLWRGDTEMSRDTVVMTLDGEPRHVTVIYTVCPGHEETHSKVFVSFIDITERKQAESERQLHENILASMDRVNRAIQSASDLEFMMRNVLDEVLDIFDCDRAYLLYPCDPAAPSWAVPMESVRPEYQGISELSDNIPMDSELGEIAGRALVGPPIYSHAAYWPEPATVLDLGTLGGDNSEARDINDDRMIIGSSETATGETMAFIWHADFGMHPLGTLGGANSQAYGINSTGQIVGESEITTGEVHATLWTVSYATRVLIDIKPNNKKNPVNLRSRGKLKIAILTTDTFDASMVDITSIRFGPNGAEAVKSHLEDFDYDGNWDVVFKVKTRETGIACGDTESTLLAQTMDGDPITGSDSITTVGCKNNSKK
jgi:probable HAF family extracellular repeat protein